MDNVECKVKVIPVYLLLTERMDKLEGRIKIMTSLPTLPFPTSWRLQRPSSQSQRVLNKHGLRRLQDDVLDSLKKVSSRVFCGPDARASLSFKNVHVKVIISVVVRRRRGTCAARAKGTERASGLNACSPRHLCPQTHAEYVADSTQSSEFDRSVFGTSRLRPSC